MGGADAPGWVGLLAPGARPGCRLGESETISCNCRDAPIPWNWGIRSQMSAVCTDAPAEVGSPADIVPFPWRIFSLKRCFERYVRVVQPRYSCACATCAGQPRVPLVRSLRRVDRDGRLARRARGLGTRGDPARGADLDVGR